MSPLLLKILGQTLSHHVGQRLDCDHRIHTCAHIYTPLFTPQNPVKHCLHESVALHALNCSSMSRKRACETTPATVPRSAASRLCHALHSSCAGAAKAPHFCSTKNLSLSEQHEMQHAHQCLWGRGRHRRRRGWPHANTRRGDPQQMTWRRHPCAQCPSGELRTPSSHSYGSLRAGTRAPLTPLFSAECTATVQQAAITSYAAPYGRPSECLARR